MKRKPGEGGNVLQNCQHCFLSLSHYTSKFNTNEKIVYMPKPTSVPLNILGLYGVDESWLATSPKKEAASCWAVCGGDKNGDCDLETMYGLAIFFFYSKDSLELPYYDWNAC